MVYYGDEAGINAPSLAANGSGLAEDDPYNRAPYPWADEAGNQNVYGPADTNLIAFYTTLGAIRKQHPALRTGDFQTVLTGDTTPSVTDNSTFSFARVLGGDKVIVALNNGATANTVTLPVGLYFTDGTLLTDALNSSVYTVSGGAITLTLPARSGVIASATYSLSGRIFTSDGTTGLRNATVSLADSFGVRRTATTSSFGFYSFDNVATGMDYTITISSRRFRYQPRTVQINADLTDVNFTGLE